MKISEACDARQFSGCMLVVADPRAVDMALQSHWNRLRLLVGSSADLALCVLDAEGQLRSFGPEAPVPQSENKPAPQKRKQQVGQCPDGIRDPAICETSEHRIEQKLLCFR